jgi:hypothetical protein
MSAIAGFVMQQAERTIRSPRRLTVIVIVLTLIVVSGLALLFQAAPANVTYSGATIIIPTPAAVCAGDTFTYPVSVTVDGGNSVSRVTEGWCRADGICPRGQQLEPYYINFVAGITVNTTAMRTAPDSLTPGGWELRHCNETHSSGKIDVVCYAVPVTIKDCPQ